VLHFVDHPITGLAHKTTLAFLRQELKERALMVKRRKEEDIAGVLEFAGHTAEDPEFATWLAEHRARKGGKVRVSKGGTGVRVVFSEAADMAWWKTRSEQAAKKATASARSGGPGRT
jgi:hypothetical protein